LKILHLTESRKLKSIQTHGLLPSKISLDHHLSLFQKDGLEGNKCIYTWDANTYENERFVRDMIYCKMFIHPRNDMFINTWDEDEQFDYSKLGKRLYGSINHFTLLEFDYDIDNTLPYEYLHLQDPSYRKNDSCGYMDEKYAHDDKTLHIMKKKIPYKKIRQIEHVSVRRYKHDTLGFSFRKIH